LLARLPYRGLIPLRRWLHLRLDAGVSAAVHLVWLELLVLGLGGRKNLSPHLILLGPILRLLHWCVESHLILRCVGD